MSYGIQFCSKCGAPIAAGSAFCSKCGQPVSTSAPSPMPASAPKAAPMPASAPNAAPMPTSASSPMAAPASAPYPTAAPMPMSAPGEVSEQPVINGNTISFYGWQGMSYDGSNSMELQMNFNNYMYSKQQAENHAALRIRRGVIQVVLYLLSMITTIVIAMTTVPAPRYGNYDREYLIENMPGYGLFFWWLGYVILFWFIIDRIMYFTNRKPKVTRKFMTLISTGQMAIQQFCFNLQNKNK